MNWKATMVFCMAGIVVACFLLSLPTRAQNAGTTLSGTVIDTSGKAVANAKMSIKNVAGGQAVEIQTNADGNYNAPNLAPGEYEVSVSAEGFSTNVSKVAVAGGPAQTMNLTLAGVLSLQDLGFSAGQTDRK